MRSARRIRRSPWRSGSLPSFRWSCRYAIISGPHDRARNRPRQNQPSCRADRVEPRLCEHDRTAAVAAPYRRKEARRIRVARNDRGSAPGAVGGASQGVGQLPAGRAADAGCGGAELCRSPLLSRGPQRARRARPVARRSGWRHREPLGAQRANDLARRPRRWLATDRLGADLGGSSAFDGAHAFRRATV